MVFLDAALLILPVVSVLGVALLASSMANYPTTTSSVALLLPSGKIPPGCPSKISDGKCATASVPVMGGVDFVEYFATYKMSNGMSNESSFGVIRQNAINSSYNGYTFLFSSLTNKVLFDTNPHQYVPEYGGFCAWAVAGEVDGYPWSAECMGPSGSMSIWSMINNKLYFFKVESARFNFMKNSTKYVAVGKERWNNWFGDRNGAYFDTNCTLYNA